MLIETVAREVRRGRYERTGSTRYNPETPLHSTEVADAEAHVLATLKAIRQLSEAVVDIGGAKLDSFDGVWMSDNQRARGCFEAMIDAQIAELEAE